MKGLMGLMFLSFAVSIWNDHPEHEYTKSDGVMLFIAAVYFIEKQIRDGDKK